MRKIFLLSLSISFFYSASAKKYFIPQDTTHSKEINAADTTLEPGDCFEHFFIRAEKISSPEKTMLLTKNGKTVSLASVLKSDETNEESQHGIADLDKDGKKELVIYHFTGGAHCCDEFSVYKNISPGKYQFAAKTFAGNVCINEENEFIFDFYEHFGYFFTCYACSYQNELELSLQEVTHVALKYNRGKLSVVPGDKELKSAINDNLGKLKEQPYQKLEGGIDQDDGLRKEFALNLVVYYYSFGKNLLGTKKLFDKYYQFPDAKKVWTEFLRILNEIKKENDF